MSVDSLRDGEFICLLNSIGFWAPHCVPGRSVFDGNDSVYEPILHRLAGAKKQLFFAVLSNCLLSLLDLPFSLLFSLLFSLVSPSLAASAEGREVSVHHALDVFDLERLSVDCFRLAFYPAWRRTFTNRKNGQVDKKKIA